MMILDDWSANKLPEVVFRKQNWRQNRLEKGDWVYEGCIWPPSNDVSVSRMGARAETGSRNMAVMEEIESSNPLPICPPLHFQPFGHKQTTAGFYYRFLKPEVSEVKLTSESLRNGSTERTKPVWPPVEQMTPRIGAGAQSGSRNMAVMAEIESSTPTFYSSPIACMDLFPNVWPQTTSGFYFRCSKPQILFRRQIWRHNSTEVTTWN